MAQVPLRMAQPGLIPAHPQRPPMMVPMTQPPPVTVQGLVSMAPMMGHGGGMAVMTQAMNHPDSGHDQHHTMTAPYPHHHPHHHHPPPHHRHPPPPSHHSRPPPGPMHNHYPHHPSHHSGHTQNVPMSRGPHHGHVSHMNSHNGIPNNANQGLTTTQQMHTNQSQKNLPLPPSQGRNRVPSPNQHHRQQFTQQTVSPQAEISVPQSSPQNVVTPELPKPSSSIHILTNGSEKMTSIATSESISSSVSPSPPLTNGTSDVLCNSGSPKSAKDQSSSIREKTPMCLINELARFNKIQHHYCLTEEKGPAHKKVFTVTLRLADGQEQYTAAGRSIKKAQHAAASQALTLTKLKKPPPKPPKTVQQVKLTPTVELNALAMKLGELATYTFLETPRPNYGYTIPTNMRGMYPKRFYPPVYPTFYVTLRLGSREFTGEGITSQQAKHCAASKALKALKGSVANGEEIRPTVSNSENDTDDLVVLGSDSALKSPISLVHEVALKRNLTVTFDVVKESGPPHMRTFVHSCTVGDFQTIGEGSGKKGSKKKAAEMMLEELKQLPPLPPSALIQVKRKSNMKKKSPSNLIKEQKADADYGQGINPISRLIQIQQAKKEREPIYTLIAERGVPRRREFVMQVTVGTLSAQGSGPNKKLAKRTAAESMLQLMGYSRPQPQPSKSAIKVDGHDTDKTRKVTFVEQNGPADSDRPQNIAAGHTGRQLVPGLIMMPENSGIRAYQQPSVNGESNITVNVQTTAAIAKELLETGTSNTAQTLDKSTDDESTQPVKPSLGVPQIAHQPTCMQKSSAETNQATSNTTGQAVRPKDQLMYLATILNLQVQFTDFPKGNKSEYLSLVSLSTSPPHVSHGAGTSIDASHDQACLTALRALAEMGLDSVTSGNVDASSA